MINTHRANLPLPPVPPQPGTQNSTCNRTRSHIRFLGAAFVVQTVVTIALFLYLFQRTGSSCNEDSNLFHDDLIVLKRLDECEGNSLDEGSMLDCKKVLEKFQRVISKVSQPEGKVDSLSAPGNQRNAEALAQMTVEPSSVTSDKILRWNRDHSILRNVDYHIVRRALQIQIPGYYYVHSHITFTRTDFSTPLAQTVMCRRKSTGAGEDLLMKAFCSMRSGGACSASQGRIVRLEEGHQLYVNVTDLSLVNFEVTATTFGCFLLQRDP